MIFRAMILDEYHIGYCGVELLEIYMNDFEKAELDVNHGFKT